MEGDYSQELLPSLAPPPRLPKPTHSDVMGFMKMVDALKYCIIKLRRSASCQGGSGDVLEERQRSCSRSRHRDSDEGEPSHRRRSPEVRKHSQSQRQPRPSQPFQDAQWQ